MKPLEVLEGERFACHTCGRCCRGEWLIEINEDEAARLSGLYPEVASSRHEMSGGRETLVLARRPDRSCVFLDDDNLCRVQKDHGSAAKPDVCRLFPYFYRENDRRISVHLSRTCPSVFHGRGPALDPDAVRAGMIPSRARPIVEPNRLAGRVEIDRAAGTRILAELSAFVLDERFALDEAVRAGGIHLERLYAGDVAPLDDERRLDLVLDGVRLHGTSRGLENYLLAVATTVLEAARWGNRFRHAPRRAALLARLLFHHGEVRLTLLDGLPVPLRGIDSVVWPRKGPPDLAPLRRWLASHLVWGTVAKAGDLETGYRLLAGAYCLARRFARMRAAAAGRDRVNADDLFEGVAAVEYDLLLHRPDIGKFGRSFWVRHFVRRFFFAREFWGCV